MENRSIRRAIECRINNAINQAGVMLACDRADPSNLVIAHSYSLKSVRTQSRDDEGPIMVNKAPDPISFENASDLFNSIQEKLNDPRFAIYAPVAYENPVERRELRNKIKEPILKALEDFQP
jgi:hypothetical protein